jgi:DHA2 family multidrug resistance protein
MWHFGGLNGDITYGYAARSRNSASRCCFCTTASYDGIPSDKTNRPRR